MLAGGGVVEWYHNPERTKAMAIFLEDVTFLRFTWFIMYGINIFVEMTKNSSYADKKNI